MSIAKSDNDQSHGILTIELKYQCSCWGCVGLVWKCTSRSFKIFQIWARWCTYTHALPILSCESSKKMRCSKVRNGSKFETNWRFDLRVQLSPGHLQGGENNQTSLNLGGAQRERSPKSKVLSMERLKSRGFFSLCGSLLFEFVVFVDCCSWTEVLSEMADPLSVICAETGDVILQSPRPEWASRTYCVSFVMRCCANVRYRFVDLKEVLASRGIVRSNDLVVFLVPRVSQPSQAIAPKSSAPVCHLCFLHACSPQFRLIPIVSLYIILL